MGCPFIGAKCTNLGIHHHGFRDRGVAVQECMTSEFGEGVIQHDTGMICRNKRNEGRSAAESCIIVHKALKCFPTVTLKSKVRHVSVTINPHFSDFFLAIAYEMCVHCCKDSPFALNSDTSHFGCFRSDCKLSNA